MDFHDFRVCDFALFYCGVWMVLVFWGGLKGWNFDPRGGFKAKVDNQDSTSWGLHFGGSARAKIMKFHGFKNALFSLLILTVWCFWGAIWMVLHCIFIEKPLDVCQKWEEVARRISGRQKRSDGCQNLISKKRYKTCVMLMVLMCSRCQEWSCCWF